VQRPVSVGRLSSWWARATHQSAAFACLQILLPADPPACRPPPDTPSLCTPPLCRQALELYLFALQQLAYPAQLSALFPEDPSAAAVVDKMVHVQAALRAVFKWVTTN
jgi:hypothetical protein